MIDYNRRQYQRMSEALDSYRSGSVEIGQLIATLDALLELLQEPKEALASDLRHDWGVLEEIYAVSLDRGKPFNSQDEDLISRGVERMRSLLERSLPQRGDDTAADDNRE